MEWFKRARLLLLPIPLVVVLLSVLPGCGGDGDPMKASDGTPKKTPSEVLKEAKEQAATTPPKG